MAQVTFRPNPQAPARSEIVVYHAEGADEAARDAARFGLGEGTRTEVRVAMPDDDAVTARRVAAVAVPLEHALPSLVAGPERVLPAWQRPPDSLVVWSRAARFALRLVEEHRIVPLLLADGDEQARAAWSAFVGGHARHRAVADGLAAALPPAGHALVDGGTVASPAALLEAFCAAVADLCVRRATREPSATRPRARVLPWTSRWLEGLTDSTDPSVPLGSDVHELVAGVASWVSGASGAQPERVELTLEEPEHAGARWPLAIGLRREGGDLAPASQVWRGGLDDAARLQDVLLRGLGRAARVFAPLDEALGGEVPDALGLDREQAWRFVSEAAPALEGSDVVAVVPQGLDEPSLGLRVRLDADADGQPLETDLPAALEDAPARISWEVVLDGEAIEVAEAMALLEGGVPLVSWRGRWVRLDPSLRERLVALPSGRLSLPDALLLALAGQAPTPAVIGEDAPGTVEVVATGRVEALVRAVRAAADRPAVPPSPPGFHGTLRGYQRRGVAWLGGMGALGLGAILADAMGLGKTPQLIAHLLARGDGPHLVVCPTSVVGNWAAELERFAPALDVTRYHGPDRPGRLDGIRGVVVTSYGLLRRDPEPLTEVAWDVVTLDEAQHVKNARTAGARAVRRLVSNQTVVLTGTPLENRLVELWALLDATNRGLFGGQTRFAREFVAPIERQGDQAAAARLRRVVAPFILRREKDDPEVAVDLPDKIERTVTCALTPEQAQLYEAAIAQVLDGGLDDASPMARRGRVLALLTSLKQVCNHPAHFLREAAAGQPGGPALTGRSGKLAAAREIVGEAVEAGEGVLVFTQFVEMGKLLMTQFSADLGVDVPFLHGGVNALARDRMVAGFQADDGPPVLIVSLRAGGTGLNLTRATQVIHYDRWWNPAVEDQATDRTHRIGQLRTVEVHKLVTAGTVEERIAALLERKRELAESVVGAGEAWVTELGEDDLRDLVELAGPATPLDDEDAPLTTVPGVYSFEEAG